MTNCLPKIPTRLFHSNSSCSKSSIFSHPLNILLVTACHVNSIPPLPALRMWGQKVLLNLPDVKSMDSSGPHPSPPLHSLYRHAKFRFYLLLLPQSPTRQISPNLCLLQYILQIKQYFDYHSTI